MSEARRIVSDIEVRRGQYCFEGTRIPVATTLVNVRHMGEAWVLENYPALTPADLAAAAAFDWPPLIDTPVAWASDDIVVGCVCGEAIAGDDDPRECRACGRRYRVAVSIAVTELPTEDEAATTAAGAST